MTLDEFMATGGSASQGVMSLDDFMNEGGVTLPNGQSFPQAAGTDFESLMQKAAAGQPAARQASIDAAVGELPKDASELEMLNFYRRKELISNQPNNDLTEFFRAAYESETDPEKKRKRLIDFQIAERRAGVKREMLNADRQDIMDRGISVDEKLMEERNAVEQDPSSRLMNAPIMRGATTGVQNAASNIAETALRILPGEGAPSDLADKIGRQRAAEGAYQGFLDEQQGNAAALPNAITQMTAEYLPLAAAGVPATLQVASKGANDAYLQSDDDTYALTSAVVQGALTYAGGKLAGGTFIDMLGGKVAGKTLGPMLKGFGIESAEELGQLYGQALIDKGFGVGDGKMPTVKEAAWTLAVVAGARGVGTAMSAGIEDDTPGANMLAFVENPSQSNAAKAGVDGVARSYRERKRLAGEIKSRIETLSVTTNGDVQLALPSPAQNNAGVAQDTQDSEPSSIGPIPEENTQPSPETSGLGATSDRAEGDANPPGPTTPEGPVQMAAGIPISKATGEWLKRTFLSGGLQTEDVRKLVYRRDSIVRGHAAQLDQNRRDLMREARKAFGKVDDSVTSQLDAALKDPAVLAALPTDVAVVVQQMRDHIDGLSDQIQALGDTSADLFLSIEKNKGAYITRSYKKFKDPSGWARKATSDPQIMGDFAAEVRQSSPNATDEDILTLAERLLRRQTMSNADLQATGSRTNNFVNVLKKRKDLSDAIRQLYGENKDAFVNYVETIEKMSNLVAHKAFVENLKADGLAKGYFSDSKTLTGGHVQEVAHGTHRQLEGLQGMFMEPELATAINDLYAMPGVSKPFQVMAALSATGKAAKTVWSFPKAWARNFLGNPSIALANGHWWTDDFGRAAKNTWYNDIFNQGDASSKAVVRRLKELGVIEGVHMEAIKDAASQVSIVANAFAGLDPQSTVKRFVSGAGKGYQAMDTIWKIHNYYGELDVLQKAYPNMPTHEVEEMAARRVRALTPTYSEASKAAKFWSRYMPVGPFSMFPSEIIRTTGNRAAMILEDAKSGNPDLQKLAARRAVGQIAALGMGYGLLESMKLWLGISDEQEEAMRDRVPEWQRNSIMVPVTTDKDGMPREYIDLGFTDPFGVISKPIMAQLRGKPDEAIGELTQSFTSEDVVLGTMVGLYYNRDEHGRPIWNEGLTPTEQNKQIMRWASKRLEPGTVTAAKRISTAAKGETTASGQELSLTGEIVSNVLGTKMQVLDRQTADYYRNREFNRKVQDSGTAIRQAFMKKGTVDLAQLEQVYRSGQEARRKTMEEWRNYIDGGVLLGETNPLAKVVADVGSKSDIVKQMYSKRYGPYVFRAEDLRDMSKLPDGPARIELWKRLHAEASKPID